MDYSEVIRDWASHPKRQMGPFETAKMEETRIEDLTIRFGYPYVYVHQVLALNPRYSTLFCPDV